MVRLDPLTGLPLFRPLSSAGRPTRLQALRRWLDPRRVSRDSLEPGASWLDPPVDDAVVFAVDVVRFVDIINEAGYYLADRVLAELGTRLRAVTEAWPAYRVWADQFLVFIRSSDPAVIADFEARIRASFEQPIKVFSQSGWQYDAKVQARITVGHAWPGITLPRLVSLVNRHIAKHDVDMAQAALARDVALPSLGCGHVRSPAGFVDTTSGGQERWCLGCILAFTPGGPIRTMSELLQVEIIDVAPGARIYPSCLVDPVICECHCDHASWTPCRTAAIRDHRFVCPACLLHDAAAPTAKTESVAIRPSPPQSGDASGIGSLMEAGSFQIRRDGP
jgi:GGDEF domain-containing protein